MSRSRVSRRAALLRALGVLTLVGAALTGIAGTSFATALDEVDPGTPGATVSSGTVAAGVPLGTLTWAVAGFTLLVLGFVAASRAGRRDSVLTGPALSSGAIRTFQASTQETHGEPASAAMTI